MSKVVNIGTSFARGELKKDLRELAAKQHAFRDRSQRLREEAFDAAIEAQKKVNEALRVYGFDSVEYEAAKDVADEAVAHARTVGEELRVELKLLCDAHDEINANHGIKQ